jgi:hypothetical protein
LGGNPNCLGEVGYNLSLDNLQLDLRCSEDLCFKLLPDMYDERDCLLLESYKLWLLLCIFDILYENSMRAELGMNSSSSSILVMSKILSRALAWRLM